MTIGIVGLGLIGGSMAKSIKLHTDHRVLGCDIQEAEVYKAELMDAIDGRLTDATLPECDILIVAVYPKEAVRYVRAHLHEIKPCALVIDCCGVKRYVCDSLRDDVRGRGFTFIGGHPMAGREYSGFRYARDDLFERASMILTPDSQTDIAEIIRAKAFFLEIGFLRVVVSTPEKHDEMIAYTSQMAHVISSAYVKSELAMTHKGFSAGSFQDMTRVARLNEQMWTELFLLNTDVLTQELDGLIERLCAYRQALASRDEETLTALLREGRLTKETLSEE